MISGGPFGEMGNEGLNQIPAGLAEFWRAAEISGIPLDQGRIELMLADQQAESITQSGLAIAEALPIQMARSGPLLL
jgi:hypothetical protein